MGLNHTICEDDGAGPLTNGKPYSRVNLSILKNFRVVSSFMKTAVIQSPWCRDLFSVTLT